MSNLTRLRTSVNFVNRELLQKAIESAGYRHNVGPDWMNVYDDRGYLFYFQKAGETYVAVTGDELARDAQKAVDRIAVEYQKAVMTEFYRRKGYIKASEKAEEGKVRLVLRRY